jgi:hypothetical protein
MNKLEINSDGYLTEEEEKLAKHVVKLNERVFAFEERERGKFRDDYFSPYIIPVEPHVPWEYPNIPIPPGHREEVIQMLKEFIAHGVYGPSQSSYRSKWFCVVKKNGKLHIVHNLELLNTVTIRDIGIPPNLDEFVEPFAGYSIYTVLDLFWGFYARTLHPSSRDMTSFMTLLGLFRIASLFMGFTNSPAEF